MESDTFATNPAWGVLAAGRPAVIDALQSAYARIKSTVAHLMDDGFVTLATALEQCRGRQPVLDKLCTSVLGKPPMLHRAGDQCPCIPDGAWVADYDFYIHGYLAKNPARRERDRKKAQDADRRDHALRSAIYKRDGGCCRYCRSGPLSPKSGRAKDTRKRLEYDHPDPDRPADGGTNYVLACKRCNAHKGERTPDEADMVLLPEPSPAEITEWQQRGLALFDLPDHEPDHARTTNEPRTNHEIDHERDHEHDRDPENQPDAQPMPPLCPEPITNTDAEQAKHEPAVWGLGRGGPPAVIPSASPPRTFPGQPARSQAYPDIYHGRSRPAPTDEISAEPIWPPTWPPGSVPVTPPPATHRHAQPHTTEGA